MKNVLSIFKREKKPRLTTDPIGFTKKIQMYLNKKIESFKKGYKESKDWQIFVSDMFNILITGILGSVALTFFGFQIKIMLILAIGAGWFLLSKKILPEIKSILSAISIVKIN